MKRKIFSILFASVLVLSLSLVTAVPAMAQLPPPNEVWVDDTGPSCLTGPGNGTQLDPFCKIQDGIDAVATGGTVYVAAGTYDEQVVINKSLTLQGAGDTTIVQPSSDAKLTQVFDGLFWYGTPDTKNIAGIIVANVPDGSAVTVKNLKVDESSVTTKPAGADYLAGIFYRETGGIVDTVTVLGAGAWSSGDRAYGMYLSAATNTVSVEIEDSTITNFDKNGIEAMGDKLTANIHDNTITGRGSVDDEVQNGVNVGRGAAGTVNTNTISNMSYSPLTWWSAGVIVVTGGSAEVTNNTIEDCQIGVIFDNSGGEAEGNTVAGGEVGLLGLWAQYYEAGTWTVTFSGNTVTAANDTPDYENAAIGCQTWDENASVTFVADNNTVSGNTGTTADGIYIGDIPAADPAGNIVATITNNTISNWQHGICLVSSVGAGSTITGNTITNNISAVPASGIHIESAVNANNVSANFNNIVGKQTHGAYNGGTGNLDAENNWWGDASGPSGVGPGIGDAVSDNVDYDPWLTAAVAGAQTGESPPEVGPTDVIDAEVEVLGGSGTVTVAQYEDNPGTGFSGDIGKYIDVHIDDPGNITEIEIRLYYTDDEIEGLAESSLRLYWWDGEAWVECSDSGVNTEDTNDYSGYIWARIRDDTTPSLDDLTGIPFGGSGSPRVVGGTVYPVNKVSILMPWIGLAVALALAGVFGARLARSRVRG